MTNCPIKHYIPLQSFAMMLLENLMPFDVRITRQRMFVSLLFIYLFTVNFCSLPLFAAEVNEPVRVRIFNVHNITAKQAKELIELNGLPSRPA